MAQASLLHRPQNFRVPGFHGYSSQQLSHMVDSFQEAATHSTTTDSYRQTPPMAQPYPQQCTSGVYLNSQRWPRLQAARQPYDTSYAEHSSTETTYRRKDLWAGGSMFNGGTTFNSGLQMPHIVSDSDASSYANNGLTYPNSVSREYPDGASVSTGLPWFPACPAVFPCNASVDRSDPETISSHSPESYTSDTQCSEIQAFSAAPIPNTGPPISDWGYYSSPSNTAIKASSPKLTPDMTGGIAGINFSGLPRAGLDISDRSPTSIAGNQSSHGLGVIYEDNSQYGSDLQPSQNSSPEVSPWFSHGQPHDLVAMPLRPKDPPVSSAPIQSMSGTYQAQLSRNMPRELAAWGESRASVPQQEPSESRFHTRRTMETHDQRKADDEILLDGKRDGLTYKEISKKMHVKCAESTLRGRYRSLTKARKDRVRKPVWHKKDIELLEVFVMQDLDRIDSNNHQSLSYDQRLAKVQWKKVADSIHANGGTYHFGNSTCKRKWQELSPNS